MARDDDPALQLERLAAALAQGELARGYVLRGAEPWFREQAWALVREAARARGAELCTHDGRDPDFSLARALDDLAGSALFASERLVTLRDVDVHLKKAGKTDALLTRAAAGFLARAGAGTLVIASEGLRADHAVVKAVLAAGGSVVNCRKLYDSPPPWERSADPSRSELAQWFAARCRAAGAKIDREQAALVTAAVGNDLFALEAQLEALRTSSAEELVESLGFSAAGKPFQVADDMIAGRAGAALAGLEGLFRGGFLQDNGKRELGAASLGAILMAPLLRNVRQALAGAEAREQGADLDGAAAAAGVGANKLALQALAANLALRPRAEWRRMLAELVELDRRAKSGARLGLDDWVLLSLRWRVRPARAGARRSLAGS